MFSTQRLSVFFLLKARMAPNAWQKALHVVMATKHDLVFSSLDGGGGERRIFKFSHRDEVAQKIPDSVKGDGEEGRTGNSER